MRCNNSDVRVGLQSSSMWEKNGAGDGLGQDFKGNVCGAGDGLGARL